MDEIGRYAMTTNDFDIAKTLLKWAEVLDIPSGNFVNEDLRAGAAEILRLRAELAKATTDKE
jgi:hypothetical protein